LKFGDRRGDAHPDKHPELILLITVVAHKFFILNTKCIRVYIVVESIVFKVLAFSTLA